MANIQFQLPSSQGLTILPSAAINPVIAYLPGANYVTYYYLDQLSGAVGNRTYTLRVTTPTTSYYGYESLYSLAVDVVLFEANGIIQYKYYQIPASPTEVTIGIAGSTTDYVLVLNDGTLSLSIIEALLGAVVSFIPNSYTSQSYTQPSLPLPVLSSESSYNICIQLNSSSLSSITPLSTSAVSLFTATRTYVTIAPIGFTFTFYGVAYVNLVVSSNGNIQFSSDVSAFFSPFVLTSVTPAIVWLYNSAAISCSYQTTGLAGNRQFLLRLGSSGIDRCRLVRSRRTYRVSLLFFSDAQF